MSQVEHARATLDDLLREEGKAELIGGRIVRFMATGYEPNRIAGRIFRSLDEFAEESGSGVAFTDNMGFAVPELASGRESFSPDASYYVGPEPANRMRFIQGAPTFAIEVRSENDYGTGAEGELRDKRRDYFAAGTEVVWDVDPVGERIDVYRGSAESPVRSYGPGEIADAEPAVPGWRMPVDRVFGRRSARTG
jgi:Uma2 family endonuclease